MANNNLNNKDFQNAASLNAAIKRDFLDSERRIVGTSYLTQGVIRRTLSSKSISDALSGSTLIGNLDYNNIFMAKYSQSQLENTLGSFGDSFQTGQIDQNGQKVNISGSLAYSDFLANTLLGKRGFESINPFQDYLEASLLYEQSENGPESYVDGQGASAESVSAGALEVALKSDLENRGILQFYIERGQLLSSMMGNRVGASVLLNGFDFDINDNLTQLTQTGSYFPGTPRPTSGSSEVSQSLITQSQVKAYISAALIELLIMIEARSGLFISGGFGTQRASNQNIQGSNNSPLRSMDNVSDHVFGRAFDIMRIGTSSDQLKDLSLDVGEYESQLTLLLVALNSFPDYLKPDLIVVHQGLAAKYGIGRGLEGDNTLIKQMYPGLRYVNFAADDSHKNHIHISFSPERAGLYTGAGGQMNTARSLGSITGSSWADVAFSPSIASAISGSRIFSDPKFISSYANSNLEKLSEEDMFLMLSGTVFSPQVAAIFANMTFRESSNRPVAINGGWTSGPNRYLNSYAVGFLQINMRTDAHGGKYFYLPIGALGQPDTKLGWQLAVDPTRAAMAPYNKTGLTTGNINDFLRNDLGKRNPNDFNDQEKVGIANPILWIPLNQAFMLPTVARGIVIDVAQSFNPQNRLGVNPEDGYLFGPWSDYGGGAPFVGFLFRISYEKVIQLCSVANVSENQFKNWFRTMMNSQGSNSKARPYVDDWLSGKFFNNYNSAN
jgi:hypothetical protein